MLPIEPTAAAILAATRRRELARWARTVSPPAPPRPTAPRERGGWRHWLVPRSPAGGCETC